jgi:hypothetical protein
MFRRNVMCLTKQSSQVEYPVVESDAVPTLAPMRCLERIGHSRAKG